MQIDSEKLKFIGKGPKATGPSGGWHFSKTRFFKCISCGDFINPAQMKNNGGCKCGKLFADIDHLRFGSDLGDDEIEVYELI